MRKTILLVDDEQDILDMLKLFLEPDYHVLEATTDNPRWRGSLASPLTWR